MKWKFIRFPLEKIKWDCFFHSSASSFYILFVLITFLSSHSLSLSSSSRYIFPYLYCTSVTNRPHCTSISIIYIIWIFFVLHTQHTLNHISIIFMYAVWSSLMLPLFIMFKPMSQSSIKFMSIFVFPFIFSGIIHMELICFACDYNGRHTRKARNISRKKKKRMTRERDACVCNGIFMFSQ